jgi:hypothetical protein
MSVALIRWTNSPRSVSSPQLIHQAIRLRCRRQHAATTIEHYNWFCRGNFVLAARLLEEISVLGAGSRSPHPECICSLGAERAAGCEKALDIEEVIDGGVNGIAILG